VTPITEFTQIFNGFEFMLANCFVAEFAVTGRNRTMNEFFLSHGAVAFVGYTCLFEGSFSR
jgi:hypothetical protein